ncbi:MAG: acyl-CoA thioesterase, partial [Gammaproteobacteria bacterium]
MNIDTDYWEAMVRDYEVDFQGIVNNANYYHYLDHARYLFFLKRNIDLKVFAANGINVVLVSSNVIFKSSLKLGDTFIVKTQLSKLSRIRLCFKQEVYSLDKNKEKLCLTSEN